MILSARAIRRPRVRRTGCPPRCAWCERPLTGPHLYLYGSADGEPPWGMRLHFACLYPQHDAKTRAAAADCAAMLAAAGLPTETRDADA